MGRWVKLLEKLADKLPEPYPELVRKLCARKIDRKNFCKLVYGLLDLALEGNEHAIRALRVITIHTPEILKRHVKWE